MKYVSLDLETTSLEPHADHILMLSMVVEDTSVPQIPVEQLPHFTCFVRHADIRGQAYALGMNGWILDYLSGRKKDAPYPIYDPGWYADEAETYVSKALAFLDQYFPKQKITVAGKNVAGFDMQFLPPALKERFRHKVLDPGTVFVDWKTDDQVPNFEQCKQRAGLNTPVAHDAREDAMDVIRLLRKSYT